MKVIKLGHISVPLDNLFTEELNIDGNVYTSFSNNEWINAFRDKDGNIVIGIDRKGEVHVNTDNTDLKKQFIKYFIQTIIENVND